MKKGLLKTFKYFFVGLTDAYWCCLCLQPHAVILFNGSQQTPHAHLQAEIVTGVFGSIVSHDHVHYCSDDG